MSKAALEALTLAAAREGAASGVRANVVRPGMMDNDRLNRVLSAVAAREGRTLAEIEAEQLRFVALGRKLDMEEVAASVLHLVGPSGAGITGQILEVDGGLEWEM